MADNFNFKITTENEVFTFDFTQMLALGETITNATQAIYVMNGEDSYPSDMFSGPPFYTNTTASQRLVGGLNEVTYRLAITISTSLSNTYVALGDLTVFDVVSVQ